MTLSDLLTLVGILLAIIAFISEKNREYILLKFSKFDAYLLLTLFLFINYLISFDWWLERFPFLSHFEMRMSPTSGAWAYIFSLLVISILIWKLFWGKFPIEKLDKLLGYYTKLMQRGDYSFLTQLIEKYHLNQIKEFIENDADKKKKTKTNLKYGESVFGKILSNEPFMDNVVNFNPYLFAQVIESISISQKKEEEFINRFLKILMNTKNDAFFKEVRNNTERDGNDFPSFSTERPIIQALLKNINACDLNRIWKGVAEPSIKEIENEAKQGYSILRKAESAKNHDDLWNYRIQIAIAFFDLMVRQAIAKDFSGSVWMTYYYYNFTSAILENMADLPSPSSDKNRNSGNFKLIETIFENLMNWIRLIQNSQHTKKLEPIFECIGLCIYEVALTNKLKNEDSVHLIGGVLEGVIEMRSKYGDDDASKKIAESIIDLGFEKFKQPTPDFTFNKEHPKPTSRYANAQKYISIIQELGERLSHDIMEPTAKGDNAKKFKKEVVEYLRV